MWWCLRLRADGCVVWFWGLGRAGLLLGALVVEFSRFGILVARLAVVVAVCVRAACLVFLGGFCVNVVWLFICCFRF